MANNPTRDTSEPSETLDIASTASPAGKDLDDQDGGYGWIRVTCQLMITANTWGVNGVNSLVTY